jgi:hypothetical protein
MVGPRKTTAPLRIRSPGRLLLSPRQQRAASGDDGDALNKPRPCHVHRALENMAGTRENTNLKDCQSLE